MKAQHTLSELQLLRAQQRTTTERSHIRKIQRTAAALNRCMRCHTECKLYLKELPITALKVYIWYRRRIRGEGVFYGQEEEEGVPCRLRSPGAGPGPPAAPAQKRRSGNGTGTKAPQRHRAGSAGTK